MELRDLQYFLAVAREESITRAAEALHMTQPPLSRQLKNLEEELGVQLFIRGSRKITLTEQGMLLRRRAEEMVELIERTREEISADQKCVNGDIYIGCGESEGMRIIARTIRTLQQKYPQIRCHLVSGNYEDLTDRLDSGLFDFCVLLQPWDYTKYDNIRLPFLERWGVLMLRDSPLAAKKEIRAEDLAGLPLIASRQAIAHNELSGWLGRSGETLNITATYNLLHNAVLLVEEQVGYLLCLDRIVPLTDSGRLCFRPLEPQVTAGLDIVWKKYRMFSQASQLFLDELLASI